MDLLHAYQLVYFQALQAAGIPRDAARRTPDQQSQAVLIFFVTNLQVATLPSITQAGLEAA